MFDVHKCTCPNLDREHFRTLLKYAKNGEYLYKDRYVDKLMEWPWDPSGVNSSKLASWSSGGQLDDA